MRTEGQPQLLFLCAIHEENGLFDIRVLRSQFFRFEEFGESAFQISGAAVSEAEVLVQQSQRAAVPANLQTFFQLRDGLRPIVRGRSRQREITQSLSAIHNVLLRLRRIKPLLKLL